ncbi:MAG: hypothetical protein IPP72_19620 [Chitinophagaceae bacterium]|nr:hypothetical protein [Chitinophagaceae bacterium]
MPASKSRHAHKHPHHQNKPSDIQPKAGNENRIVTVAVLFFTVIGLAIGFFIDASNIPVLLASAAVGALAGLVAGRQLKKSLSGK